MTQPLNPKSRARNAWLSVFLVGAILVVVHFLANHFPQRVDLTENKLFTLNPASRKAVADLNEPLYFKLYFSRDLPPRFQPVVDYISHLVEEYRVSGKGMVQLDKIDPGFDEVLTKQANNLGVYKTKANVTQRAKTETLDLWFGMVLVYGDERHVFPTVSSVEGFEYDVTSAILKLTHKEKPTLLFTGPNDKAAGHQLDGDLKALVEALSTRYKVDQAVIAPGSELEFHQASGLIVWGLHEFNEAQRYALDQFIMSGRPVVLLVSGVAIDTTRLTADPRPQGPVDEMFARLGFSVNRDLVMDTVCTKIKFAEAQPVVLKDYHLFPMLSDQLGSFDADFGPATQLNRLIMPWVSSLKPAPTKGIEAKIIAKSSEQSWLQKERFVLDPDLAPGPTSFESFPMGLELSGTFASAFDGAPVGFNPDLHQWQSQPNRILVWGTHHMLGRGQNAATQVWLSNMADYLVGQQSLAGIDRKENAVRPIREPSADEKRRIQWLSITVAPLLILLFALFQRVRRVRRDVSRYLTRGGA